MDARPATRERTGDGEGEWALDLERWETVGWKVEARIEGSRQAPPWM